MNDIESIEKFYYKRLDGDQLNQFLFKQKNDRQFAAQISQYTEIFNGIRASAKTVFKQMVFEWENERKNAPLND